MSEQIIDSIENDHEVKAARQRREALLRERDVARAACWRLRPEGEHGPLPVTLEYLSAYGALAAHDGAVAASERGVQAAEHVARGRIAQVRRPGRDELLRRLLGTAEAAVDAARVLQAYDEATASAVGLGPGQAPVPALLRLVPEQVEAATRAQRDDAPAVPGRGKTRVRLLTTVWSVDRLHCWAPGDVVDLDAADARDAVNRKFAEVRT